MKKVYMSLLFLLVAALLFFTLYGASIYPYGKSIVTTARVNSDMYGVTIPLEALRNDGGGDYVYVLRTEQAYLNEIITVLYVPVTVLEINEEQGTAYLPPNPHPRDNSPRAWNGDRIVLSETKPIQDGERVIRATGDKRPITLDTAS